MNTLIVGLVIFFGVHSISIVAPAWRDAAAARIGPSIWRLIYSLLSLIGFVLMVRGYRLAGHDPVVLYSPPPALTWIALVLMVPVFPLLFAAYLPGRLRDAAKHPMLAATKFWALAHLLTNGTLAAVLLFGSFLAWAVADRISFKRRVQRPIRTAPPGRRNDLIAVVAGLVVYLLFVAWAHLAAFGVSPLPP
jgi:uncharacterized membrane protein